MTGPLYKTIDGELVLSLTAMALLLGVSVAEVTTSMQAQGAPAVPWVIPTEWARQGRRIVREAQAATGREDLISIVEHLAGSR